MVNMPPRKTSTESGPKLRSPGVFPSAQNTGELDIRRLKKLGFKIERGEGGEEKITIPPEIMDELVKNHLADKMTKLENGKREEGSSKPKVPYSDFKRRLDEEKGSMEKKRVGKEIKKIDGNSDSKNPTENKDVPQPQENVENKILSVGDEVEILLRGGLVEATVLDFLKDGNVKIRWFREGEGTVIERVKPSDIIGNYDIQKSIEKRNEHRVKESSVKIIRFGIKNIFARREKGKKTWYKAGKENAGKMLSNGEYSLWVKILSAIDKYTLQGEKIKEDVVIKRIREKLVAAINVLNFEEAAAFANSLNEKMKELINGTRDQTKTNSTPKPGQSTNEEVRTDQPSPEIIDQNLKTFPYKKNPFEKFGIKNIFPSDRDGYRAWILIEDSGKKRKLTGLEVGVVDSVIRSLNDFYILTEKEIPESLQGAKDELVEALKGKSLDFSDSGIINTKNRNLRLLLRRIKTPTITTIEKEQKRGDLPTFENFPKTENKFNETYVGGIRNKGGDHKYEMTIEGYENVSIENKEWMEFLDLFGRYRRFISLDGNKEKFGDLISLKDALINDINSGDINGARIKKKELEEKLPTHQYQPRADLVPETKKSLPRVEKSTVDLIIEKIESGKNITLEERMLWNDFIRSSGVELNEKQIEDGKRRNALNTKVRGMDLKGDFFQVEGNAEKLPKKEWFDFIRLFKKYREFILRDKDNARTYQSLANTKREIVLLLEKGKFSEAISKKSNFEEEIDDVVKIFEEHKGVSPELKTPPAEESEHRVLRPARKIGTVLKSETGSALDSSKKVKEFSDDTGRLEGARIGLLQKHEDMYGRDPDRYIQIYSNKTFDDRDLNKEVFEMMKERHAFSTKRNALENKKTSTQVVEDAFSQKIRDEKLKRFSGGSNMETLKYVPEKIRESPKFRAVNSMMETLGKHFKQHWGKYLLATSMATAGALTKSLIKNDTESYSPNYEFQSGQTYDPSLSTEKKEDLSNWRENLQYEEIGEFFKDFGTSSEKDLIDKYVPSSDSQYGDTVLNLDAFNVLNNSEVEMLEGCTDQKGVFHRKEICDVIKNLEIIAEATTSKLKGEDFENAMKTGVLYLNTDTSLIKEGMTVNDLIKAVKSRILAADKRDSMWHGKTPNEEKQ